MTGHCITAKMTTVMSITQQRKPAAQAFCFIAQQLPVREFHPWRRGQKAAPSATTAKPLRGDEVLNPEPRTLMVRSASSRVSNHEAMGGGNSNDPENALPGHVPPV
jgi:hypothetical protein